MEWSAEQDFIRRVFYYVCLYPDRYSAYCHAEIGDTQSPTGRAVGCFHHDSTCRSILCAGELPFVFSDDDDLRSVVDNTFAFHVSIENSINCAERLDRPRGCHKDFRLIVCLRFGFIGDNFYLIGGGWIDTFIGY